jgi:hypothetical protein
MSAVANPLRGEADLNIGGVELVIAVEFGALAKLSRAIGAQSMDEIYRRLFGFEPFAVAVALQCLSVHPDGAQKAAELAAQAGARLTAADQDAWRKAAETAFTAHIDAGRQLRGEPTLAEQAAAALRMAEGDAAKKKMN